DHAIQPVYKLVDTCAAEFESYTPYYYSTYDQENESYPSDRKKIIILGGGPNRIGQGIEFDYCCVHASFALEEIGVESIMVNANPETVSTDYDTSDRLYFEPLTREDVLSIIEREKPDGVIVQFGGMTPLTLAQALEDAGIPILGTSPDAIDLAEDRERFAQLVNKLKLKQPENGMARTRDEAVTIAERIGYPVLIRPSFVLGGRAMEIVDGPAQLENYINTAVQVSGDQPVLVDQYLRDAIEVDVDAICDGDEVIVCGVLQHIEEAGVHSGDSACTIPPYNLSDEIIAEMERQTEALAFGLKVRGLMNIQFAVKNGEVYLIEVNPRASRTVPFVAKAIGTPIAKIASRVMAGEKLTDLPAIDRHIDYIAVKEAVFPFNRFPGIDPVLSPEMKSTGEVMGIDQSFAIAFAKSQLGANTRLPDSGTIFISVKETDKKVIEQGARLADKLGFKLIATSGTADYLTEKGIKVQKVNKVAEGRPHIVDLIKDGEVNLIFNTTEGWQSLKDSKSIRAAALVGKIPIYTTATASNAVMQAIEAMRDETLEVRALQSYYKASQT
ncbi:MAG: carbamoyl-phosphate synthase large subunit, partial [Sphingorhabdus sp.]